MQIKSCYYADKVQLKSRRSPKADLVKVKNQYDAEHSDPSREVLTTRRNHSCYAEQQNCAEHDLGACSFAIRSIALNISVRMCLENERDIRHLPTQIE